MISLKDAEEEPKFLLPEGGLGLPIELMVVRLHKLAGRFCRNKTVVDDLRTLFLVFYWDLGQHLRPWIDHLAKCRRSKKGERHDRSSEIGYPSLSLQKDQAADSRLESNTTNFVAS